MIKDKITKAVQKASGEKDVHLEVPELEEHGDYATNVALVSAKKEKKNPLDLAEEIIKKLRGNKNLAKVVSKIEVAGPGFVNFWLSKEHLLENLKDVQKEKEKYGYGTVEKDQKVIVEYSSPNIAKPFTIGHLRSTIIGDAIANILEATGWKVLRDNHLGDWGTQFGKQIYAIKAWGDEEKIEKSKNPIKDLVELYIKFHEEAEKDPSLEDKAREWFKKLEEGDVEARRLWKACAKWSWVEFDKIYSRLNINFSKEFEGGKGLGEAFFEDKMKPVIKELEEKDLLKEGKEGAKLVFFKDDKYPPAMILKKDGTTLYHTRDLATDRYRKDRFEPDLIINEVGVEQKLYFQQLFEMERMLGWFSEGQRVHVAHGLFRFKGGKMSTRKGNVIWLTDVLEEAVRKAKKLGSNNTKMAEIVGIGALKWNDLKRNPASDIVFDWDEVLNMEGNSGPYLQYTVARCNSVLQKAPKAKSQNSNKLEIINYKLEVEEELILRSLARFSEVIIDAGKNYSPNLLANYLFDLAQKYNSFYNKHKIIKSKEISFRLALTFATRQVLKNGLKLLGIGAPERM